ncbi:MAG: glycosyltransferase family 2 protein [Candidatus Omnitrophica bacterium]|nr:glycosyltransferase family 2 protein [Candidatus Omnitrophota bacterium]
MISVIIPTFNRESLLKKTIDSILSQTYQGFELIIVDDGSTDDTPRLISGIGRKIIYIKQENKGPASARNLGIKNSSKPFIAFLDSDDSWEKDKLEIQLKAMRENPDFQISHTNETWHKNGRLLNQKKKHKKCGGYIFDKCLSLCAVSMSTVMIKKEIFDTVGMFDESLSCCEDYDFWLRASVKHKFLLIEKPLTLKDGGRPDQVSSIHRTGIDKFRIKSILKLLEIATLTPKQQESAKKELQKKCQIYGKGCLKHGRAEEGRHYLTMSKPALGYDLL